MIRKHIVLTSALALCGTIVMAQGVAIAGDRSAYDGWRTAQAGGPSGRGSTTGDPAASSATPGSSPTTGSATKSNPSGSGTSSSGGKDENGDQGRDKMPETNKMLRPK